MLCGREHCSQPSHQHAYNRLPLGGPLRMQRLRFQCVCLSPWPEYWSANQSKHMFRRHFSWATVNNSHMQLVRKAKGRQISTSAEFWMVWQDGDQTKWSQVPEPDPSYVRANHRLEKAWDGWDLREHLVSLMKEDQGDSGPWQRWWQRVTDKGSAWTLA